MNSENSNSTDAHRLRLNLADKINLRRSDKLAASLDLSIYCTWKNLKRSHKNNKFKISKTTWDEEFKLPDGSYSISDIQGYFEYIIKKHETLADIHQSKYMSTEFRIE